MKTKILLTSAIMACSVGQVLATSYDENETYPSSCNYNVLSRYQGTRSATANFEQIICDAGEYLNTTGDGCSTCPNDYPNSLSGATSQGACYTSCDISSFPGAASVIGHDYYGDTVDTCEASSCTSGYSLRRVALSDVTLPSSSVSPTSYAYKQSDGVIYGDASGLDFGEWKMQWTSGDVVGTLKGISHCSTNGDSGYRAPSYFDTTDSTGQYCFCRSYSWTPQNGSEQLFASSWIGLGSKNADCVTYCARICVTYAQGWNLIRQNTIQGTYQCVANTITINWQDANGGTHESNTCTYDGDLVTPTTAPTKFGFRFTGWTFQ